MKRNRSKLAKAIFADGRTLTTIARAAGVSICTISQVSNGRICPRLETALRIAGALHTTPGALGLRGLKATLEGGAE
ncbi:MAG: helix-turn-helix domain-containing protein [Kiritimatiellae bacterium]|nr:helix-turn-helix domain-containing protein [Kiritimatiellia bacterium]